VALAELARDAAAALGALSATAAPAGACPKP